MTSRKRTIGVGLVLFAGLTFLGSKYLQQPESSETHEGRASSKKRAATVSALLSRVATRLPPPPREQRKAVRSNAARIEQRPPILPAREVFNGPGAERRWLGVELEAAGLRLEARERVLARVPEMRDRLREMDNPDAAEAALEQRLAVAERAHEVEEQHIAALESRLESLSEDLQQ